MTLEGFQATGGHPVTNHYTIISIPVSVSLFVAVKIIYLVIRYGKTIL